MTEDARSDATSPPGRYHHGDLAAALVAAGLELVRGGGPDALGLREATRIVGVSPSAAYRHFTDRAALVAAVADRALQYAAEAMQARMTDEGADPVQRAYRRLRAVGLGYIDFALAEPGLFQLAFQTPRPPAPPETGPASPDYISPDEQGANPLVLLMSALDDLVAVGVLPAERRPNAEWSCWSAVHGLSDLATRGPLHAQDRTAVRQLAEYVVDAAITGVVGHDRGVPPPAGGASGAGAEPAHG